MRDLSLDSPTGEGPARVTARRCWRALRVLVHLLAGILEAVWLRAGRDPQRVVVLNAKRRWCLRFLTILGVELRVQGPLRAGPVLLVSNHVSWLDIPVIAAARPCYFLSKAEVAEWPVIGWLARAVGTLFIRRGGGESKAKAEEIRGRLDRGHGILVFPEGTTTDGTGVRRFFPQLFAAAGDDAPVQTVAVRYRDEQGRLDTGVAFIDDDEFHHHLWRLLGRRRIVVELTFGAPLPPDEPRALAREARERIVADLGATAANAG
ncbi:MAG TPA: 1-acyl-sn-glycerol-3-phosphate acyltransferase [Alcanivorax sp.]|nr:1-acyl-sn-glycerol-3-phosphate acyltransferase [Alcanivorax sp.]